MHITLSVLYYFSKKTFSKPFAKLRYQNVHNEPQGHVLVLAFPDYEVIPNAKYILAPLKGYERDCDNIKDTFTSLHYEATTKKGLKLEVTTQVQKLCSTPC